MLPSAFTLANMLCGFSSLRAAQDGHLRLAAALIGAAVVFDMFDGAVARAVGAITPFGLQFDSLADLVSFGIAPAMLLQVWALEDLPVLGWVAACTWLACAAFRLGRFNVTVDPLEDRRWFIGLPSPAAAGLVIATVFAVPEGVDGTLGVLAPVLAVGAALLMASSVRFRSFRSLLSTRGRHRGIRLAALGAVVAALVLRPAVTGIVLAWGYVALAPLGRLVAPVLRRFGRDVDEPGRHRLPSVFLPDATDDEEPAIPLEDLAAAELLVIEAAELED